MAGNYNWDPVADLQLNTVWRTRKCHGWAPSKERHCHGFLGSLQLDQAQEILYDMADQDPHGAEVKQMLPNLARLVLCMPNPNRGYNGHQDQAYTIVEKFKDRLAAVPRQSHTRTSRVPVVDKNERTIVQKSEHVSERRSQRLSLPSREADEEEERLRYDWNSEPARETRYTASRTSVLAESNTAAETTNAQEELEILRAYNESLEKRLSDLDAQVRRLSLAQSPLSSSDSQATLATSQPFPVPAKQQVGARVTVTSLPKDDTLPRKSLRQRVSKVMSGKGSKA
jgi:hypothetical protein